MCVKNLLSIVWWIVVISFPTSFCSDWKPIVPPADYYATQPPTCVGDCGTKFKFPVAEEPRPSGVGEAESQVKSALLNQPLTYNQDKDFHQTNKKLDLEVSFLSKDHGSTFNSHLPTYEDVLRKTPSSFFNYKTINNPYKPTKTVYYGDLESAKLKLPEDGSFLKGFKIAKPSNFIENEVKAHRPIKGNPFEDHCSLYKVSFRQDIFYQYIQYKVHVPELKEFTICLWFRLHNESYDHSLFSYGAKPHRKGIYMWVNNLHQPGLFNMRILGQNIFRLNYPFMLYKWYHTCQSWNGNSGEWQVWVDSHRIARGFHNLLVGHPIPGGGLAISGQEQRHFGKEYQEIPKYLKGSGGLDGEITMLQLYKVALTPGKAYNDHSYHHSHYTTTTPEPPELPSEEPSTTTDHPFLENGQLKKHINVLELAETLRKGGHLNIHKHHHQPMEEYYAEHHLHHPYAGHLTPVVVPGNTLHFVRLPAHTVYKRNDGNEKKEGKENESEEDKENTEKIKVISGVSGQVHVEKLKYKGKRDGEKDLAVPAGSQELLVTDASIVTTAMVGNSTETYSEEQQSGEVFGARTGKRTRRQSRVRVMANRPKRIATTELKPVRYPVYRIKKKGDGKHKGKNAGKESTKRHIIFGDPFSDIGILDHGIHPIYSEIPSTHDQFPHFGVDDDGGIGQDDDDSLLFPKDGKKDQEEEVAQGEVKKILRICSGCHADPFRKVAVISWRTTPKKIYSGALLIKARTECENF